MKSDHTANFLTNTYKFMYTVAEVIAWGIYLICYFQVLDD